MIFIILMLYLGIGIAHGIFATTYYKNKGQRADPLVLVILFLAWPAIYVTMLIDIYRGRF